MDDLNKHGHDGGRRLQSIFVILASAITCDHFFCSAGMNCANSSTVLVIGNISVGVRSVSAQSGVSDQQPLMHPGQSVVYSDHQDPFADQHRMR